MDLPEWVNPLVTTSHFLHFMRGEINLPSKLMDEVFAVADAIAGNAPLAVTQTRRGVREILDLPTAEAYVRQEELGAPLRRTHDAREGQRAFVEKRAPVWKGR